MKPQSGRFGWAGVKISFNLRGGTFTKGPEIVIFNDSCSTFLFDAFKAGVKIRLNPRDGGFSKRPNYRFQDSNWPILLDKEGKIGFNLRGGIFTQGPEIVIFSGSCSTSFLFFWARTEY